MRKKSLVYHRVDPEFSRPHRRYGTRWKTYRLVAEVATTDLDKVFMLTNHTDIHWFENKGVYAIGLELRSTSVGDIIVTPDGYAHLVLGNGFRRLGKMP